MRMLSGCPLHEPFAILHFCRNTRCRAKIAVRRFLHNVNLLNQVWKKRKTDQGRGSFRTHPVFLLLASTNGLWRLTRNFYLVILRRALGSDGEAEGKESSSESCWKVERHDWASSVVLLLKSGGKMRRSELFVWSLKYTWGQIPQVYISVRLAHSSRCRISRDGWSNTLSLYRGFERSKIWPHWERTTFFRSMACSCRRDQKVAEVEILGYIHNRPLHQDVYKYTQIFAVLQWIWWATFLSHLLAIAKNNSCIGSALSAHRSPFRIAFSRLGG